MCSSATSPDETLPTKDGGLRTDDLFSMLNQAYGDTYDNNAAHKSCIQEVITMLSPGSQILDLGVGTGRPTASMLTSAGMHVTGIDVSPVMISIARKNVPSAVLHLSDMTTYQPSDGQKFDAVVAIFSILHMPTSDIRAMAFRMSHWLKSGGLLVLGAIDFTDVPKAEGHLADPHGEWLSHRFMGQVVKDNTFGPGQWVSLLRSADVSLISMKGSIFETGNKETISEPQCFFIGRRGIKEPLMGPWPLPLAYQIPQVLANTASFAERLVRADLTLSQMLGNNRRVLEFYTGVDQLQSLGNGVSHSRVDLSEYLDSPTRLDFSAKSFDAVVAHGTLQMVPDLGSYLEELCRLVDPSAPNARIVLTQAAPYNELTYILNRVSLLADTVPVHHGGLLHLASNYLKQRGFIKVRLETLENSYLNFPETSLEDKCKNAAQIITQMYFANHENIEMIRWMLLPELKRHFESQRQLGRHENEIRNQGVALLAWVT